MFHLRFLVSVLAIVVLAAGPRAGAADVGSECNPEMVIAGFNQRVDAMFRAEAGQPVARAKKLPPLGPGRGKFVREYSYSLVAFAARCLYLGEMLDEANAALAENARHYLDHPKDIYDRDSFHWHAEIVMRLLEMYGPRGIKHPGRITPQTEALCLQPIFAYARQYSRPERWEVEKSGTWEIYESENHHVMSFTVCWHFAKIAQDRPEYRQVPYNGLTPAEHYRQWNEYFVAYCRERARKGLFIEMMSGDYNSTLIKGIYNFYDFGEPAVRQAAGQFLDLYFAYWAEEQINGVSGGGKSRIYFANGLREDRREGMGPLAWLYFGIGEPPAVNGHDAGAALSDYRPPAVVADIALDVPGRGRYEVRQRAPGLAEGTGRFPYRLRTDGGGIVRYSYCDPAFILGTVLCLARPLSDWSAISAQNRWQGVIFAGKQEARIVPIPRPKDNRVAFNQFWSVQSKGSLITQKLRFCKDAAEMIVWMSPQGLGEPVEDEGIVFVEAAGAYAAVRVVAGGFTWRDDPFEFKTATGHVRSSPPGRAMILQDEYAPVILEVMAKTDVPSFEAFKAKVKACRPQMDGTRLRYRTIYGDELTLDTGHEKPPTINGEPVNYAPKKVFDSPFLHADYNSGTVTISKGDRKLVLDFTNQPQRKE